MLDVRDGVAWLTLNRPTALNALNAATVEAFGQTVESLRGRKDVRVVVTRGEGRAFCAGSDLRELQPMSPGEAARHEVKVARILSSLDTLPQPTIAMLHGYVLGGGLGMALYHDFRIAAPDAVLALPEVELGWTPPWAVGRLVDAVGMSKARLLLLTACWITGLEALNMGLVDKVACDQDLEAETSELALRLAGMPPEGLDRTKKLLRRMSPLCDFSWDEAAAQAFEACYATPQARGRIAEFLAKKKPPSK